jgi:zinc/manganese transport system permease protein
MPAARWTDRLFYPAFAVVASLAVPTVGLFIVFAALIAPALRQRAGLSLVRASIAAFAAAALGLAASWILDWPSGSCVALALAVCGVSVALDPRSGSRPN